MTEPVATVTPEPARRRPSRAEGRRWLRRFLIEALIDAALLVVIVLVLGIIHVPQPFPFGTGSAPIVGFVEVRAWEVAWFAAAVVLANRFARPVIVAVVGRLVLRTLGLFVVVINALTIWQATLI